jgi:hypothetical protein
MVDGRWSMVDGRWSMVDGRKISRATFSRDATIEKMWGPRSIWATICFALIFTSISLSSRFAHAQSKQEIRLFAGGELGGTSGDAGNLDLAPMLGVSYAPNRFLSFGVLGAYSVGGSGSCAVSDVGGGGSGVSGCSTFSPYRVTGEIEVDPFRPGVVDPFFVLDGGVFGEHDHDYDDDPKLAPTFGGGAGLHFFPIDFLSIDVALRFLYADFSDHEFGSAWWIFSVGVTPRIQF